MIGPRIPGEKPKKKPKPWFSGLSNKQIPRDYQMGLGWDPTPRAFKLKVRKRKP